VNIGDRVVRKSYNKDIVFKIIDIETDDEGVKKYLLKGLNIRIEADSIEDDLEVIDSEVVGEKDKVFNKKVNTALKKVLTVNYSLEDQVKFFILMEILNT